LDKAGQRNKCWLHIRTGFKVVGGDCWHKKKKYVVNSYGIDIAQSSKTAQINALLSLA